MAEPSVAVDIKGAVIAYNEGIQAMEAGQEAAAVAAWRRAIELDPCLVPAAINLATYYQDRGDVQAELAVWEQIIAYDPFDTDHLVLQAAAFRRAKQLPRAVENYHRAIAIYPYFKFWYHELAAIYEEMGEREEASLWRGRGDSLGADEAEICYEDGIRHTNAERWKSARTCFEAILDEFPANLDARLRLARVLEKGGTPEEVVAHYQQAMELTDAAKGLVHYRLGEFHIKQGALEEGARELAAARRNVPLYRRAERALWQVQQQLAKRQPAAAPAGLPASLATPLTAPATAGALPGEAPLVEAVALLSPEDIELEPVLDSEPRAVPTLSLRPPNQRLPWPQQLRQVLDQALAIASPGGREPRVAVVVEPDRELSPVVLHAVGELRGLGRSLRADPETSHIFVVQSHGDAASRGLIHGWLGQDGHTLLKTTDWNRSQPGLPLSQALRLVQSQSNAGFNCLLVISFGRCTDMNGEISSLLRSTPLHCLCFVHPGYHYVDLRAAVRETAPNFVEITC